MIETETFGVFEVGRPALADAMADEQRFAVELDGRCLLFCAQQSFSSGVEVG